MQNNVNNCSYHENCQYYSLEINHYEEFSDYPGRFLWVMYRQDNYS